MQKQFPKGSGVYSRFPADASSFRSNLNGFQVYIGYVQNAIQQKAVLLQTGNTLAYRLCVACVPSWRSNVHGLDSTKAWTCACTKQG